MEQINISKKLILGLQHVLAMFGATVLVPILTGLDPGIALLCAGIGTLVFHSVTKGIVPVFLGSSFAFISAIAITLQAYGIGVVKGGIIATGLVYVIMAGVIKLAGVERVKSFFPPIVVGPIIMVIGLRLSPVAINMIGYSPIVEQNPDAQKMAEILTSNGFQIDSAIFNNVSGVFRIPFQGLLVATIVIVTMIIVSIFAKGFFKMVPILISVIVGYLAAMVFGMVDIAAIVDAPWFGFSDLGTEHLFTLPKFTWEAAIAIAPIALVVFIEHIGDITTNGAVVGKNFFDNPGVHRTLLGDGLATMAAGLLGGPANTTYGENTGVLAVTKVYDPNVIRIAAVFAIVLSLFGKFTAIIQTIPTPVMGGISIILFGMIASVGVRTLVDAQLDFTHSRNLIIAAIIFVTGISIDNIAVVGTITISGLAIAALIGVVLNKVLPQDI
ncbi:uracil-xanthine permease family protein [Cellulosilyticum sp. I15G10I2]|uniref:uracil-xanthine permease family protein n=1 Tax=Cellulosilyticum sp. I15G10I2 TaxID=1892843 RepID=UPI00085C7AAF|nr:uracil-xanthine permease family protein [Cellulosilyticum sp. I15G10I2]